jgi:beta-galactosidase
MKPAGLKLFVTAIAVSIIAAIMSFSTNVPKPNTSLRHVENWWSGWKFVKGADPAGASDISFNDTQWSAVTIPHDYSMDGPYSADNAMLKRDSTQWTKYVTWPKDGSQGYMPRQIGWYRKTFTVSAAHKGKKIFIEFDGAFRNSYTYLNGVLLGNHYSGYTSFVYDMTPYIKYGAKNVLAVKLDAEQNEGWWYEGRGIYRPVRLVITDKLHVAKWGTYVTTPTVKSSGAVINIKTKIANEYADPENCTLQSVIFDDNSKVVGTISTAAKIGANGTYEFNQHLTVAKPKLWCPETPYLYKVVSKVLKNGVAVDDYATPFGIRTYYFDADKGFFLNGKHYKLNGVCNHDDYAGLGDAIPKSIHYQNIKQLADAGVNYLRGAHGARSPEEMDACDKYGVMVWAETRYFKNTDFDSQALRDLIDRDRNHPSIILWSLANEDKLQGTAEGLIIGRKLKKVANEEDPIRPVTSAIDRTWALDGTKGPSDYKDIWDVNGYNWIKWENFDPHHKLFPNRKILISEYRYYTNTDADSSNDFIQKRDFIAGSSMWTGMGYKGESVWPMLSRNGSMWNMVHEPDAGYWRAKAAYGFQANKWSVHVNPSTGGWKGADGEKIVFNGWTNCEKVDVYINNVLKKTITMRTHDGTNPWSRYKYLFDKDMAIADTERFAAGSTIRFSGKNAGVEVDRQVLKPMLGASKIMVTSNPGSMGADGEVSVVTITIRDANGNIIKTADAPIKVTVSGAGTLIGLGSGDIDANRHGAEPEKFIDHKYSFEGMLKAFIQANGTPGKITVTASGAGLPSGSVIIATTNQLEISAVR